MENFKGLVSTIEQLHANLQQSAVNAVNRLLTMRNWLIGYYIVEFEQKGKDRAEYGKSLLKSIAEKLSYIKGLDERSLRRFRQFYLLYPQLAEVIWGSVAPIFDHTEIRGTLPPILTDFKKIRSASPQSESSLFVPGDKLVSKLSYSHIEQLLGIDDPLKRMFYEVECIKGTWSVRELKRQITSLYFERSGLSEKPEKLAQIVRQKQIHSKI